MKPAIGYAIRLDWERFDIIELTSLDVYYAGRTIHGSRTHGPKRDLLAHYATKEEAVAAQSRASDAYNKASAAVDEASRALNKARSAREAAYMAALQCQ